MRSIITRILVALFITLLSCVLAKASIFTDDFDAGTSSDWLDIYGTWDVTGGQYHASSYEFPDTGSPYAEAISVYNYNSLSNFSLDVDVYNTNNVGFVLRSSFNNSGFFGFDAAVVLTIALDTTNRINCFIISNGILQNNIILAEMPEFRNNDLHVRVAAKGDTFSIYAYILGDDNTGWNTTPIAAVNSTDYGVSIASGYTGLYTDTRSSGLFFDNVNISVPEPLTVVSVGFACLAGWIRLRKK